jgi:hypothetical protein
MYQNKHGIWTEDRGKKEDRRKLHTSRSNRSSIIYTPHLMLLGNSSQGGWMNETRNTQADMTKAYKYVGFEVLTAVVMKSSIF